MAAVTLYDPGDNIILQSLELQSQTNIEIQTFCCSVYPYQRTKRFRLPAKRRKYRQAEVSGRKYGKHF